MNNIITIFAFLSGLFLQAYFLLRGKLVLNAKNKEFETDRSTIILLAIFCLLPLLIMYDDPIDSRLIGVGMIFILLFPAMFHTKILPLINERKILQLNVLVAFLFYLLIEAFNDMVPFFLAWMDEPFWVTFTLLLFVVPTAGTLFVSFIYIYLSKVWKTIFYAWFLLLSVILIVYQLLSTGILKSLLHGQALNPGIAFTLGMALLVLMSNLVPVLMSFHKDGRDIRKIFHQNYSDRQISPMATTAIILSYIVPLWLNHYFGLVPDYALINVLLLLTFFYDYLEKDHVVVKNIDV